MSERVTVQQAITKASVREINGGELESIGTIYRPEGVALVIAQALGLDPDMPLSALQARLALTDDQVEASKFLDGVTTGWLFDRCKVTDTDLAILERAKHIIARDRPSGGEWLIPVDYLRGGE